MLGSIEFVKYHHSSAVNTSLHPCNKLRNKVVTNKFKYPDNAINKDKSKRHAWNLLSIVRATKTLLCFKLSKFSESIWWERWRPKMTNKLALLWYYQCYFNNLKTIWIHLLLFIDMLFLLDLQYNRSSWCHAQTVLVYSKALKTATAHNSPIIYRRFDFWYQSVWRRRRRRILWFTGFKDNITSYR